MKKITALLLALCLLCPAALATEITDSGARQTDTIIRTEVAQSYTVIIPPEVNIPFEQLETTLTIEVTELHLSVPSDPSKAHQLSVAVQSKSGALENSSDASRTIPYTIEAADGSDTLLFDAAAKQDMTVRIAQEDWNRAAAGEYADTVTFNITIAETDK